MASNLEKMADKVVDKVMKNMPLVFGPSKLKDLIKSVRSCKTAAEEREVVAKESATIRTSFKEGNSEFRHRNVAKLLYIHMLGYSAQFGQIECIKLAASSRFADKRLGYLGVMLLLDENQEVLTLVTNSIKNDLNHSNMYIVGLALSTLANISSSEMARDLVGEVEKLLDSSHSYVRKKAALAAIRIIQKEPELHENFLAKARSVLGEKNHAVLLTGITLVYELCKLNHDFLVEYRQNVPTLVKLLKAVCAVAQSAEHEVNGISDPFLQIKIVKLLRILGIGSPEASDTMSDVLAQVATNTDGSKNVGNAILYETVKAIMDIESESGLRVLAVNILGKFLSNNADNRDKRDNNIRYVALNTLLTTVEKDLNAVQRHRKTVVECLRDPDISIRRRALDLSFVLINESNVRVMIRELLTFLEKADKEFKPKITNEICMAAETYAPNKRWHIDTILRTLRLAGNFVKDDILSNFVRLVITSPELHSYAGHKLYKAVRDDMSQEYLVYAAVWVIGEYGDAIIREVPLNEEEDDSPISQVNENDIIDLLESIMRSPFTTASGREYTLMALMKLTTRFSSSDRIKLIIRSYTNHIHSEIQQRASEFTAIFDFEGIRNSLLEKMPPPEAKSLRKEPKSSSGGEIQEEEPSRPQITQPQVNKPTASGLLEIDLMGDAPSIAPQSTGGIADLSELLGLGSSTSQPSAPRSGTNLLEDLGLGSTSQPMGGMNMGMNMGGMNMGMNMGGMNMGGMSMGMSAPPSSGPYYEKNGLKIQMDCQIDPTNPAVLNVNTTFFNTTMAQIDNLNFQVAVPKTLKLQILPPSSASVPAFGTATQVFRIANPSKAPIKVRLRITFVSNGVPFEDTCDLGGFPQM